ncbi:unnamed protein product [Rotaria socialis]|uniref:Hexosyltransferase n=1 Tax=Rotaria socialis TaxID=392032 RepID=A0A820LKN4_9BILA|nr:unnamed protein product [Rotaria socialis]CAF4358877.1 unnamed protein product [Rotaria socialis]
MLHSYRSCRRFSRPLSRYFPIIIVVCLAGLSWCLLNALFSSQPDNYENVYGNNFEETKSPLIFCFVTSANDRHLTSARAIAYSWGKRCDRFYFIARLQNTSINLMILEYFENITDITVTTITQKTFDVLAYLETTNSFKSYNWFLRASDDSFVIIPNLRQLVRQLNDKHHNYPLAYVGDVEQMFDKYQIATTGSVMLFNRRALYRLTYSDDLSDDEQELEFEREQCFKNMIYDHEFVRCMEISRIKINPMYDNLILSQNLSFYKMDKRFQGIHFSPNTVAFRSSNDTDMYKFEFLYHRLDVLSKTGR